MAIASIRNATVARVFYEGKGASVYEEFTKRDGETGKSYYTLFFDNPHGLSEGDQLSASGLLSVRSREYQDKDGVTKHSADAILNSARAEDVVSGGGGSDDSDTPF